MLPASWLLEPCGQPSKVPPVQHATTLFGVLTSMPTTPDPHVRPLGFWSESHIVARAIHGRPDHRTPLPPRLMGYVLRRHPRSLGAPSKASSSRSPVHGRRPPGALVNVPKPRPRPPGRSHRHPSTSLASSSASRRAPASPRGRNRTIDQARYWLFFLGGGGGGGGG